MPHIDEFEMRAIGIPIACMECRKLTLGKCLKCGATVCPDCWDEHEALDIESYDPQMGAILRKHRLEWERRGLIYGIWGWYDPKHPPEWASGPANQNFIARHKKH